MHDAWKAYFLSGCHHSLFCVHTLRELTFLSQEMGLCWTHHMILLLRQMKHMTDQARLLGHTHLSAEDVRVLHTQFLGLLDQRDQVHLRNPTVPSQRGKPSNIPLGMCWVVCVSIRTRFSLSCTISTCRLTTTSPSTMFRWSKSSKKSLAPFAVMKVPSLFIAFVPTCLACANKDSLCLRLWRRLCGTTLCFLLGDLISYYFLSVVRQRF